MQPWTALADPTRREIVEILARGELSAGQIAAHFKMSPPAVSQHLKTLREARLISMRIDAQRRIYRLESEGFDELEMWLAHIRRFWSAKLDLLEKSIMSETEIS